MSAYGGVNAISAARTGSIARKKWLTRMGRPLTRRPPTPLIIAPPESTAHKTSTISARPVRILTAKVGLDGHDRGIKIISRALRDAGAEVIYTGLHQTPAQVVEAAIQEDVDGIGISLLSGAHMTLFPEVLRLLRERGGEDIVVFGGGIVPADDALQLKQLGVDEVFTPGTSIRVIVEYVERRFGLEKVGAGTR